ncbi:unnamed protein product [Sympodiomycopsis kandeliae]
METTEDTPLSARESRLRGRIKSQSQTLEACFQQIRAHDAAILNLQSALEEAVQELRQLREDNIKLRESLQQSSKAITQSDQDLVNASSPTGEAAQTDMEATMPSQLTSFDQVCRQLQEMNVRAHQQSEDIAKLKQGQQEIQSQLQKRLDQTTRQVGAAESRDRRIANNINRLQQEQEECKRTGNGLKIAVEQALVQSQTSDCRTVELMESSRALWKRTNENNDQVVNLEKSLAHTNCRLENVNLKVEKHDEELYAMIHKGVGSTEGYTSMINLVNDLTMTNGQIEEIKLRVGQQREFLDMFHNAFLLHEVQMQASNRAAARKFQIANAHIWKSLEETTEKTSQAHANITQLFEVTKGLSQIFETRQGRE